MNRAYDSHGADQLIPLLRSVQREIRERADQVRRLRIRVANLSRDASLTPALSEAQAEIANHKREMRLARKELERLGCALDGSHPERVLIPGETGDLTQGFSWCFGDGRVHAFEESGGPVGQNEQAA